MKLKLSAIPDDKPVKLTLELPAAVHRDLVAYTEALGRQAGQKLEPTKLVAPMLARFMATDRAFARLQREKPRAGQLPQAAAVRAEPGVVSRAKPTGS